MRTLFYTPTVAVMFLWLTFPLIQATYGQRVKEKDDTRGKEIAAQFSKKMAALKSFKATMGLEVKYQQVKTPRVYNATIEARGNQYYFSGMGLEVHSDGKTRWQHVTATKELTITAVDSTSTSPLENPLRIFSTYQNDFKIQFLGERTEAGQTFYDLSLYPYDINQSYSQIHLAIHKQSLLPAKLSYFGRDGSRYVVDFKSFEPNAKVRTQFVLDLKQLKGVTVTDLRE